MNKQSIASTGLAGEYFVAAELSRMGHLALISLRNWENVDILASRADGTRTVSIQVKTQKDKLLASKAQNGEVTDKLCLPRFEG